MAKQQRVYTGPNWRKPAVLLDAQPSDALVRMPSGEEMLDVQVAVDDETFERMREGRICANCFEPLEIPFPEICEALKLPDGRVVGCGYRVRARQLIDLEERYGAGEQVHIGSRINRADEVERLTEMDEFERRTGIIIPDHVKFPTEIIQH